MISLPLGRAYAFDVTAYYETGLESEPSDHLEAVYEIGLCEARYNYWGTLCPQPSQFYGRVDVVVWVDPTHTVVCLDCEHCYHSTEATTWGAIKALFE